MIKYTCLCYFTGYYNHQSVQFTPGQVVLSEEPILSLEQAVVNGWAKKEIVVVESKKKVNK